MSLSNSNLFIKGRSSPPFDEKSLLPPVERNLHIVDFHGKSIVFWFSVIYMSASFFCSATAKIKVEVSGTFLRGADRYLGALKCKECHPQIYRDWERTMHSKAFLKLGEKEQEKSACLRCHATGYGIATGYSIGKKTEPDLRGVQCEACHGPYGSHLKNNRVHSLKTANEPQKPSGPGDDCRDCFIRKQCMPCHNVKHSPGFNFHEYYTEIKHK